MRGAIFAWVDGDGVLLTRDECIHIPVDKSTAVFAVYAEIANRHVLTYTCVGEGTLAVHIRHLREKIEQDVNAPAVIKTIWGVGYLMENTGESN